LSTKVLEKRGRDRTYILAKICEIASEGVLKSQIMYRANLSFRNLHGYLSIMLDLNLLKVTMKKGKKNYQTTPKGFTYLRSFREIRHLLDKDDIEEIESEVLEKVDVKPPRMAKLESEIRNLKVRLDKLESNILRSGICPACGRGILPEFRLCPFCGRTLLTETLKGRRK